MRYMDMIKHRMAHEKNALLVACADKIAVRDHVRDRIGRVYLVPAYGYGYGKTNDIKVLAPYVAKPNNACGRMLAEYYHVDKQFVINTINGWMDAPTFDGGKQWSYGQIQPGWIIEKMLYLDGKIPPVYRAFVFHGKCEMVQVYRYSGMMQGKPRPDTVDCYFPDGRHIPQKWHKYDMSGKPCCDLEDFVSISEAVAVTDHVRVDFMRTDDGWKFSELTFYPHAGGAKIGWLDKYLGAKWGRYEV